jgi:DNA-binding MarR family transcriptional regulator
MAIDEREKSGGGWTFLTNHSHVLVCLLRNPELTMREVSAMVGITERATQRIVADLQAAEVIEVEKEGRRNRYSVRLDRSLRHPLEAGHTVGELMQWLESET